MAGINNIEPFIRPSYPIITLGIASIFVLVISDIFIIRRIKIRGSADTVFDKGKKT